MRSASRDMEVALYVLTRTNGKGTRRDKLDGAAMVWTLERGTTYMGMAAPRERQGILTIFTGVLQGPKDARAMAQYSPYGNGGTASPAGRPDSVRRPLVRRISHRRLKGAHM